MFDHRRISCLQHPGISGEVDDLWSHASLMKRIMSRVKLLVLGLAKDFSLGNGGFPKSSKNLSHGWPWLSILFNNLCYYGDFWDPSALRKPPNHRSPETDGGAEVPIVPPARKFAEARLSDPSVKCTFWTFQEAYHFGGVQCYANLFFGIAHDCTLFWRSVRSTDIQDEYKKS